MINKVTRKENEELFEHIDEFIVDNSMNDHRRGATFFRQSIVEFKKEHFEYFPNLDNFDHYIGLWETNMYTHDESDLGGSITNIDELDRVEKIVKKVEVITYEKVE